MTAPAPRGEEPVAWLRRQSDNAYVRYTDLLRHERCLGAEAKIKAGTFTVEHLAAHTKAAELLGAHRAYADAAKFVAHPPADNVRDQGEVRELVGMLRRCDEFLCDMHALSRQATCDLSVKLKADVETALAKFKEPGQ